MSYDYTGWEAETDLDNDDDREGVYYLTIRCDGEESAIIVHRTCDGRFPLDGPGAQAKERTAALIVAALNAYETTDDDELVSCNYCGVRLHRATTEANGAILVPDDGDVYVDDDGNTGPCAELNGDDHVPMSVVTVPDYLWPDPADLASDCDCDDRGYLLHQTYGRTDPPHANAILVQRCDACGKYDGDIDAAKAYAADAERVNGGTHVHVWAIGDGENLAPQSDVWTSLTTLHHPASNTPNPKPSPVSWIPTADAIANGLYSPPEDETFDAAGEFIVHGRCDECGNPCDANGCTVNREHAVAK